MQIHLKNCLILKDPGGGADSARWSGDRLPFLTGLYYVHKHPKYKVVKSFFYYLDRFLRNSAETATRL